MRKDKSGLAIAWLNAWREISTHSRWQRGKTLLARQQVSHIDVAIGKIKGIAREQTHTYHPIICGDPLSVDQINAIRSALSRRPDAALALYSETFDRDQIPAAMRKTLFRPTFRSKCSCENLASSPCPHLIAVAFKMADEIDKDPVVYLRWLGVPWDQLLNSLPAPSGTIESKKDTRYGIVSAPPKAQFEPLASKRWSSPPFWISPFPFPLIMEEIYAKLKEESEDDLSKK